MRKRPSSPSARLGAPQPSIVALEKRIAFDGAAAGVAAKAMHRVMTPDHVAGAGGDLARETSAGVDRALQTTSGSDPDTSSAARSLRAIDASGAQRASAPRAAPTSVVFIESDVPDVATLIKDVDHSAQIVLLDASKDGVDSIASYLAAHKGVKDVYIFSHGSQAQLDLGTATLDSATMQGRYAADLATIRSSLAPGANILVYGCDFAEGAIGDGAAHLLSQLTGAAVGASTDLTGGTAEGGDFVLEDHVGTIGAPDVLSSHIATDYVGLLAAPTTVFATSGTGAYHSNIEFLTFANTSLTSGGITNGATATYTTSTGSTVTVTFSNVSNATDAATFKPAALSAYSPSKFYGGYNNTSSTTELLYGQYNDTSSFTVTFTAKDKNGNSYTPNIAFADGEVTDASGEGYVVTTNGGNFQNVETIGTNSYSLTGVGSQSVTLKNTGSGVPLLVTDNATSLNISVQIAGGKEGFVLALVDPTLSLDANASSGATANNYQTTFTEKGAAVSIGDTDVSAVEPGGTGASAQIVLTNAQAGDVLALQSALPSGISSSIDTSVPGQITVKLTGAASLAAYQTAIQDVTFANTSSNPSTVDRTIDVTYSDGGQTSNTAISTIHVAAVNDAPVETAPADQAANKDTALSISGLSVSDVDANGGTETVTLSVADGTLSLASTTGLTFSKGTGTNDTTETFTGTLSAIDNAIGTVKYQPTTGYYGSDTLSFSTNDNGNTGSGGAMTASKSVAITVNNVNPSDNGTIANQKYNDGQANISVATSQAFSDSLGLTLTYSATGLPKGLSIDPNTGKITGTIDHDASTNAPTKTGSGATLDGTYTVVETASDGQGGSTTQTFTIDSTNQAPVVGTKTANQTNNDGDTITAVNAAAAFSDPNSGDTLSYTASNLPAGLTINATTGMITGTVAKNAAPGPYTVTVTGTDDKGAATNETFTWQIADVPPAKNGTLANQTYNDGQANIAIATSQGFADSNGNALTYSATGLPAGLSINATTGQITGTIDHDASKNATTQSGSGATLDGTYSVTVTASDGLGGTAAQSFTIDSKNQAPSVGTKTANQANNDGDTITAVNAAAAFSDPNGGDTLTYAASNLPAGLTINATTGMITGTVAKNAAPGAYTVTVTGADDKGAATNETFTWQIADVPPAKNGTLANQTYNDGQANIAIATSQGFADSNGNALTYSATGLPAGLSINATTGQITGTIDHDASKNATTQSGSGATLDGTYSVTVTASDGLGGTAAQSFTIDSKNQAPSVGTKTANQTNNDGDTIMAVNAAAAFSDLNTGDTLTYAASNLPAGLTINATTGMITGTVSKTAATGPYSVTVTATDDKGAATNETFTWTINDVPPTAGADTFSTVHNTPVAINVLGNDTDALGRQLTVSQVNGAAITAGGAAVAVTGGSVKLNTDGTLTFTPTTGTSGSPSFTYTVADPVGGTTTANVTGIVSDARPILDLNGPQTVVNTVANGTSLGSTGWSTTNGGQYKGGYYFNADFGTGSISQANVSGLNLGAGAYGAAQLSFGFGWNNGNPDVKATTVNVTVGGVVYAQIVTGTPGSDPNIATITYMNGASGNVSSVTATTYMGWTPTQVTLDLPASVVAKGTVAFNVDSSASTDDVFFSNVSTTTLPATTYGYATSFTEKGSPVAIAASTASVFDGDDANAASASVVLTNKLAGDQLAIGGTAVSNGSTGTYMGLSYTVSDAAGAETIAFTGSATKAVYQQALEAVTYTNTGYAPSTTPRTLNVTVSDGLSTSNTAVTTIAVADLNPTPNGTLARQTVTDGQSAVSIATAGGFNDPSGSTFTYTAAGLPTGLSIDPGTGKITGTIDHDASKNAPTTSGSGATLDGTYTVSVTATDTAGRAVKQTFAIDSTNQAPIVGTPTANQTNNDGDAIAALDASKAFADPNGDPLSFTASNLPSGLSISKAGLITGSVANNAQPGAYSVIVTAVDDKGAATAETFTWTVKDVPPTTSGTLVNQSVKDGQAGIAIATSQAFSPSNGNALAYAASGLPAGLSINATTGQITGTIDHDASKNAPATTGSGATLDGTYTIVVTASDGLGGTATQSFTIDSVNNAPVIGTTTVNQTNATGATIAHVDASKAFTDPNGDPLTYTAFNLPSGLAIDPNTGIISGTVEANAMSGTYAVRVLATDDKGAATREAFTWTVTDTPPTAKGTLANETYADASAGIAIATAGAFTSPNGLALTYTASGLPLGLSIDPSSGMITGQLDHDASKSAPTTSGSGATLDGTYTVTVTASDGQGGTAKQAFKIDATNTAPTLVAQTPNQTAADRQTVSLDGAKPFSDPNTGDTFTYAATGLPTGLSIDAKTGLISGTVDPHASRSGPFTTTVTITDDKGAATSESFTWGVNDVAPVATPALPDRSVNDGSTVGIATAGGFSNPNAVPYTYTATGLPKGLSIDAGTGVISGTIDHDASAAGAGGTYAIAVTADDGQGGTATNSFHLTSSNQAPIVGTKTPDQTSAEGALVAGVDASKAFTDPNSGDTLTFAASNLPPGLTIDPKTGVISGTVPGNATPGAYFVTVTATDDKGLSTPETFDWSIDNVPPLAKGTLPNQTFQDGTAGIAIDTAGGFTDAVANPLLYSAAGLPAGLSIDQKTGRITGTLDHDASAGGVTESGSGATLDGTYTVIVTAKDALGGSATQTFSIDAKNDAPVTGTTTPVQSNTEGDAVSLDTAIVFSDPNLGDVLTYSATNLPSGLTINVTTGLISGTIASGDFPASPYQVVVTAMDEKGATAQETFSWVTLPPPVMAVSAIPNYSGFDGTVAAIDTASHFIGSSDATTVYTASGLPSGLSIDASSGRITGTIDSNASLHGQTQSGSGATLDGMYGVTVTATNAGGPASQTFVLDVANQAPVVGTRTAGQTAMTGQTIATVDASLAFSDPNGDTLTYAATGLPPGLSIDAATGKITGSTSATAPGLYAVSVTATDPKGAATIESFAWTVTDTPPTTNGVLTGKTYADSTSAISIATASGFTSPNGLPLSYRATGLPAGLSIDPATGAITGQLDHEASARAPTQTGSGATLDGTYTITVTADDGQGGSALQTFTIDATNTAPKIGVATAAQHGQDGQTVSLDASQAFSDPNVGDTLTYAATALPTGLSIDPATGLISGTIDKAASVHGPFRVIVTATDDKGAATSETFDWMVDDLAPQATPPLADRSVNDGRAVSYATTGGFTNPNGLPLTYSAMGLPAGLSIDPATGVIAGTLDHDASAAVSGGVYTVAVTVDDGQGGTATNSFHLTASNQAPVVTMAIPNKANNDGETVTPVDASKAFVDPNSGDTLTYVASNLPKGLAIDPTTGFISGTVADDAAPGGSYVTVTATDEKGASTSTTFTWTVGDVPPMASGVLAVQHVTDSENGIVIATAGGFVSPNGLPLIFSATGLPRGLSIDPANGAITGFISHNASIDAPTRTGAGATLDGTYAVVVTASDGQGGMATQTFTIDSTNQAPALGTPTADQHGADGQAVSIDAGHAFADPNTGDTLVFTASGLPAGLAIDSATGIIAGTIDPRASASGPYTVAVTATDNKGAATAETFRFVVDEVAPTAGAPIAAAASLDGTTIAAIDTASHFDSPNGLPLTFAASGLPAGLSIDPATGAITGTLDHDASKNAPTTSGSGATLDGTYTVTVTASDAQGGVASQVFTFDATNDAPALAALTPDQHGTDSQSVSLDASKAFSDPNHGDTITYAASGLPKGLSIDAASGLITGTIDAQASVQGTYAVTVGATDDKGATTLEHFAWTVADAPPVRASQLPDQAAEDGAAVNEATAAGFTDSNGLPLTYSATGLPAGLVIDSGTGVISGTLDHDASVGGVGGTYTIAVTADDGQGGSATNTFHLSAANQAPIVAAKTPDQSDADGAAVAPVSSAFTDPNGDPLTYTVSGLPAGLSIDPATGTIDGTVVANARPGSYTVAVTATDDKGASASETFAWLISDVPPETVGTLPTQALADAQSPVAIETATGFADTLGNPLTYAAGGLPAGLSIDSATGRITGTLDRDASAGGDHGTYTVTVTASDGLGGSAMQTLTIVASNMPPVVGTKTADQANADGDSIAPVDASKAFGDPNGDPLTYAASNLPPGLTIDPATGRITGTVVGNAQPGAYQVAVTATDDKGAATTETFTWTIGDVAPTGKGTLPAQTLADGQGGIVIDTAGGFADANGNALTYAATGLPPGLSIDPATGRITGTVDHEASANAPTTSGSGATLDGTYTVVVTATDPFGARSTQSFTLDARNGAPAVGQATTNQTDSEGDAVSLDTGRAFGDPNTGDVLTYAASGLPAGLSIDPTTGLVTGTVSRGDNIAGPYAVVVTATDDKGAATRESFSWTVLPLTPGAASPIPNVSGFDGTAVAIDTASHFDNDDATTTYAASGLPAGLSIDPATGRITGTLDHDASRNAPTTSGSGATLDGTYTVTVTATTASGSISQSFGLDSANQAPVVGSKTMDQVRRDGETIAAVDASQAFGDPNGDPLTYAATNLPAGLSIDPASGRITGTVAGDAQPGTYQVAITATDDKGAATVETFAWTITDVPPTANGTLAPQTVADGQAAVSVATAGGFGDANDNPLTFDAKGLPAGLSIDPKTGAVTGTLDPYASIGGDHGTYVVAVTASDGLGGTATQTFTIDAVNQPPLLGAGTTDQHGQDGQAVSLAVASAFSDPDGDPLTYRAGNLPPGLAIDPGTGVITGTIAATASAEGPYSVVVTATDSKGAATTETFTWSVDDLPPAANNKAPIDVGTVPDGTNVAPLDGASYFDNPNGLPLTYAASGLPAGLGIDPATGMISGTLDHDASVRGDQGTYTVTVTASNGQGGTASQVFTLEATNQAPALVAPTPDQTGAQGRSVAPLDASQAFADPNTGDVITYGASGLPKGLAIDPVTGLIAGTIAGDAPPGDYLVTVAAVDDKGAARTETFHWQVGDVPPFSGDLPSQRYGDGQSGIAIDTAGGFSSPNGLPLTYAATGLPAGLSIDQATGLVTGTIDRSASANAPVRLGSGADRDGIYAVTVTATDPYGGTASDVFAIEVGNVPPVVTAQTPDQHGRAGQTIAPLDLGAAFGDATGDALTYAVTGLPPGLSFDPATGRVSGAISPIGSPRIFTVTITATDSLGASVAESFLYAVDTVAPSILTPPSLSSSRWRRCCPHSAFGPSPSSTSDTAVRSNRPLPCST